MTRKQNRAVGRSLLWSPLLHFGWKGVERGGLLPSVSSFSPTPWLLTLLQCPCVRPPVLSGRDLMQYCVGSWVLGEAGVYGVLLPSSFSCSSSKQGARVSWQRSALLLPCSGQGRLSLCALEPQVGLWLAEQPGIRSPGCLLLVACTCMRWKDCALIPCLALSFQTHCRRLLLSVTSWFV